MVLSTGRLREVGVPDLVEPDVEAGAGATLERVRLAARRRGSSRYRPASRGTATIGGVVATNAGGARVLRHGPPAPRSRGSRR